jgi:hypothetical protein
MSCLYMLALLEIEVFMLVRTLLKLLHNLVSYLAVTPRVTKSLITFIGLLIKC